MMETIPVFQVQNLSLSRGRFQLLNQITCQINKGERWCILGENGAGKSTFLDCLTKYENDYSGGIRFQGSELRKITLKKLFSALSVSYQNINLQSHLTVHKYLSLVDFQSDRINLFLNYFNMPDKLFSPLHSLSGGEQRKLLVGASLFSEKEILFFDEPVISLDQKSKLLFIEKLNSLPEKTIIIITHELDAALQTCDHFLGLKNGEIIFQGDHSVMTEQNLSVLFDLPGEKLNSINTILLQRNTHQ